MDKEKNEPFFEANRELWNAKTAIHIKSDFYEMDKFMAGGDLLKPEELEALGDVSGKTLLHLQCHFGQDTLAWARRGAIVTGIDLSDDAIDNANRLRDELGLEATFIRCNIYDLPEHLDEQFDIVFTTYGAIPWLPDLEGWADIVVRYLKPGGKFFHAEFHPTFYMFDFDTWKVEFSYFGQPEPYLEFTEGTYADRNADIRRAEYFWNHSIAETLQPLLDRGLRLLRLQELPYLYWNCFPALVETKPGQYMVKGYENKMPLTMTMFLEKPL
jgi:2-polyprenyl-3-methyl-5-hydroxy-6-metoxy-1,4-benzoquinol methylase